MAEASRIDRPGAQLLEILLTNSHLAVRYSKRAEGDSWESKMFRGYSGEAVVTAGSDVDEQEAAEVVKVRVWMSKR